MVPQNPPRGIAGNPALVAGLTPLDCGIGFADFKRMAPVRESRRVLLVEPPGGFGPADLLSRLGYEVVHVSRPTHAMARLRVERDFSIVFCDADFPRIEIVALFREVRRLEPPCLAVLVSPHTAVEDGDLAADFDADGVVRVPCRHRELLRACLAQLQAAAAR